MREQCNLVHVGAGKHQDAGQRTELIHDVSAASRSTINFVPALSQTRQSSHKASGHK